MKESLTKFRIRFPTLPQDVLKKIYSYRLKRMKTFKSLELPKDVSWIIKAKVHLVGKFNRSFVKYMLGIGRSSYSKKRRVKRMRAYHKCTRWICDKHGRSKGMVLVN